MRECRSCTIKKEERICGKKEQELLFSEGRSLMAFPIRVVYLKKEDGCSTRNMKFMVCVPKRCFKEAVKRNRVKRQMREAYRRLKCRLAEDLPAGVSLLMAFIWISKELCLSSEVNKKMEKIFFRLSETLRQQCAGGRNG